MDTNSAIDAEHDEREMPHRQASLALLMVKLPSSSVCALHNHRKQSNGSVCARAAKKLLLAIS